MRSKWARIESLELEHHSHILNTGVITLHCFYAFFLCVVDHYLSSDVTESTWKKVLFPYILAQCVGCLAFCHDGVRAYTLQRFPFRTLSRLCSIRLARRVSLRCPQEPIVLPNV